jgi:hypothetical protein
MFSIDGPKPNTWVHYKKKSKALQVLRVKDHQKTRYKPTSSNGTIPQTSKTKDKAYKLQRIKSPSLQASKVHPTNFKGIIPQAHKLQRAKAYKPTNFEDKLYKFTSFKRQALQGHQLQKLKPTSPQASKVQAHKIQRYIPQISKASSQPLS